VRSNGVKVGLDAEETRFDEVVQEALSVTAVLAFCALAILVVRLSLWIIGGRTGTSSRANRR